MLIGLNVQTFNQQSPDCSLLPISLQSHLPLYNWKHLPLSPALTGTHDYSHSLSYTHTHADTHRGRSKGIALMLLCCTYDSMRSESQQLTTSWYKPLMPIFLLHIMAHPHTNNNEAQCSAPLHCKRGKHSGPHFAQLSTPLHFLLPDSCVRSDWLPALRAVTDLASHLRM